MFLSGCLWVIFGVFLMSLAISLSQASFVCYYGGLALKVDVREVSVSLSGMR